MIEVSAQLILFSGYNQSRGFVRRPVVVSNYRYIFFKYPISVVIFHLLAPSVIKTLILVTLISGEVLAWNHRIINYTTLHNSQFFYFNIIGIKICKFERNMFKIYFLRGSYVIRMCASNIAAGHWNFFQSDERLATVLN